MPSFSSSTLSWKLHDEQLPQSPNARRAPRYFAATIAISSLGAGWLALFLAWNSMLSIWRVAPSFSRMPASSSRAFGLEFEISAIGSVAQLMGFSAIFSPPAADRPNVGLTIRMEIFPFWLLLQGGDDRLAGPLAVGDRVLVNRVVYHTRPIERSDVVVFDGSDSFVPASDVPTRNPVAGALTWVGQSIGLVAPDSTDFVKRVIGVPGDRIRIENKQVYRNGKPIEEPYKYHKSDFFDSYRDTFPSEPNTSIDEGARQMLQKHVLNGEVVVPENAYFAMGDNRDHSLDSRYWGFVPRENIIGKPLIIYWSYDAPTHRLQSSTPSVEHVTDLFRNFFTKTRWRRTFNLIQGYPSKD